MSIAFLELHDVQAVNWSESRISTMQVHFERKLY